MTSWFPNPLQTHSDQMGVGVFVQPSWRDISPFGFDHCIGMIREGSQPNLVTQGRTGSQEWWWPSLTSRKYCHVP